MIHLDTNYVVGLVTTPSPLRSRLLALFNSGETFATSAVAWSEFLNGPVTGEQVREALLMLEERIVPFGVVEAELASELFNRGGRKRGSQADCFIAATALCARASLATENRKDFLPFVRAGLRLV